MIIEGDINLLFSLFVCTGPAWMHYEYKLNLFVGCQSRLLHVQQRRRCEDGEIDGSWAREPLSTGLYLGLYNLYKSGKATYNPWCHIHRLKLYWCHYLRCQLLCLVTHPRLSCTIGCKFYFFLCRSDHSMKMYILYYKLNWQEILWFNLLIEFVGHQCSSYFGQSTQI